MAAKPKSKRGNSQIGLADYPMAAPVDKKAQRRYAAEDALRTLTRAEEHRGNPRLMADVKKLAAETAAKMAKVARK
jgi:hypothetical protein